MKPSKILRISEDRRGEKAIVHLVKKKAPAKYWTRSVLIDLKKEKVVWYSEKAAIRQEKNRVANGYVYSYPAYLTKSVIGPDFIVESINEKEEDKKYFLCLTKRRISDGSIIGEAEND